MLNFTITAAGDSYNDVNMLKTAEHGILFRPTEDMQRAFGEFPVADDHCELRTKIEESWSSLQD